MKCIYVVERKNRQCRLDAVPGKRYCGNHLPPEEGGRRRIPCPINPKHSVYEDELRSHLKRCPSLRMINESRTQSYFRRDCNLGEGVDALPRKRISKGEVEPELEGTNVAALRYAAACALGEPAFMDLVRRIERSFEEACEPPPLDDVPPSRPPERVPEPGTRPLDPKHEAQTANLVGIVERAGLLEAPETRAYVELGAGKGMLGCRLAEQVPSLGAITFVDVRVFRLTADRTLRDLPLSRVRCDIKDCWVPGLPGVQGHGWVCLGKHLCGGATDMAVRASLGDDARGDKEEEKAAGNLEEGKEEERVADEGGSAEPAPVAHEGRTAEPAPVADARRPVETSFSADAPLPSAPLSSSSPHSSVNGASTSPLAASASRRPEKKPLDPSFALRLLVAPTLPSPDERTAPADGLVIASCCHHRCTWRTYVGKPFFRAHGFSPLEFELVSWMTGWALCGHDAPVLDEGADDEVPLGNDEGYEFAPHRSLTRRQRIALGTKCKRLIDAGRVDAMRRAGWTAGLKQYVDASVTGENVALTGVAKPRAGTGQG